MSNEISKLEPTALWENFYALTQIPRPSHHEEKVQEYVYNFGVNLGLETTKDKAGNIIIRKPATPGFEDKKGVILQAHLDMVPQKNSDKEHDFVTDPIETYIDEDWVKANGTTLGADNGIGAAAVMGVLASTSLEHGPIEALFTATEETGMDGAEGLKAGVMKGEIMLNTDSEDEGELYVGCAGGEDLTVEFEFKKKEMPKNFIGGRLSVTGLKGGHSGMDIILQRANANKVFFRILNMAFEKCGARLISIDGGSLRNAIPREAFGLLAVKKKKWDKLTKLVAKLEKEIKAEFELREPDMKIVLEPEDVISKLIDKRTQLRLTKSILACPNGVIRMSDSMPGLVETSSNLAVVKSDAKHKTIRLAFLMRSSIDSVKADFGQRMKALFSMAGAKVKFSGAYPGWNPNMESPILKTMQAVYEQKYGKIPEIKAIHAGLECGILGGTYPKWDMISFGPTIRFPHSPDEKVNIPSVAKFWDFMVETLKNVPVKEAVVEEAPVADESVSEN
ncbi:aminoacyl-histidine dipeptidase [Mangrovibacterium diazotrophicum]|uniref:Cytosol non-specific dipeptidase n=1 Tax=Mangrovibacterium diazotrophicum TaxID=1261403 RepID=A0A419W711_9BACT|nr:aminoacyl-histidine dipeptidase [Mangrovibacterium diazotrophicum]RKD91257.1 dipeptidase D [Mangrovibacterium diazotrophicum]